MPHEMVDGKDALVGGRKMSIWHQDMTDTTVVDGLLTAREAARIGWKRQDGKEGHWNPILVPTYANDGKGGFIAIPGTFNVCRNDFDKSDPERFISAGRGVGDGFVMLDNDIVVDFMSALTQHGAHVDTCGSIFGGQRVYMSALLDDSADVEGDKVDNYLILTTAHDGTAAFEALITAVRAVCNNTLTAAQSRAKSRVKIPHRKNAVTALAQAHEIISAASKSFGETTDILRTLARINLSTDKAQDLLGEIIPGESKRSDATRGIVWGLYNGGQIGYDDTPAVHDTAYGMVSAVTEYAETDRGVSPRKDALGRAKDEGDARFNSILFGSGRLLRERAIDKALALVT